MFKFSQLKQPGLAYNPRAKDGQDLTAALREMEEKGGPAALQSAHPPPRVRHRYLRAELVDPAAVFAESAPREIAPSLLVVPQSFSPRALAPSGDEPPAFGVSVAGVGVAGVGVAGAGGIRPSGPSAVSSGSPGGTMVLSKSAAPGSLPVVGGRGARQSFLPQAVDLLDWENDIVWDAHAAQSSVATASAAIGPKLLADQPDDRPAGSAPNPARPVPKLRDVRNEDLDSFSWLSDVVWDGASGSRDETVPLILDLNDPCHISPSSLPPEYHPRPSHVVREHRERLVARILTDGRSGARSRSGPSASEIHITHSHAADEFRGIPGEPTKHDLRHLHRPAGLILDAGDHLSIKVVPRPPKPVTSLSSRNFLTVSSSSANESFQVRDGHFVVFEYVEEYPLLMLNVGMGSRIVTYYRDPTRSRANSDSKTSTGADEEDDETPEDEVVVPVVNEGVTIPLSMDDPFPMLGVLPVGSAVTTSRTTVSEAPLFEHAVPETDFLLITPTARRTEKRKLSYLRIIPRLYLVGQIEPRKEVFTPSSDHHRKLNDRWLLVNVLKLFDKSETKRLQMSDVQQVFPNTDRTNLRSNLKQVAYYDKPTKYWIQNKESVPSVSVDPSDMVAFLHMRSGMVRLEDIGIKALKNYRDTVMSALNNLRKMAQARSERVAQLGNRADLRPMEMKRLLRAAEAVVNTLLITPWTLSRTFINIHKCQQQNGLLDLNPSNRLGDPSGRGEGFAFLPKASMPQRTETGPRRQKQRLQNTERDLRKKSMPELYDLLIKAGYSPEQIPDASKYGNRARWERVRRLIDAHTHGTAAGISDSGFAREQRVTRSDKIRVEREQARLLQQRQAEALSRTIPPELSDDDTSEDEELDSDLMKQLDVEQSRHALRAASSAAVLQRQEEHELALMQSGGLRGTNGAGSSGAGSTTGGGTSAAVVDATTGGGGGGGGGGSGTADGSSGTADETRIVPVDGSAPSESLRLWYPKLPVELRKPPPIVSHVSDGAESLEGKPLYIPPVHHGVLRRVTRKFDAEGNETIIVDFFRDPAEIADYKKRHKVFRETVRDNKKPVKPVLLSAASRKKLSEIQRKQQQIEELEAAAEKGELYEGKKFVYENGKKIPVCQACHMKGHKKNNKNCPLYTVTTAELETYRDPGRTDLSKPTLIKLKRHPESFKVRIPQEKIIKKEKPRNKRPKKNPKPPVTKNEYSKPNKKAKGAKKRVVLRPPLRQFGLLVEAALATTLRTHFPPAQQQKIPTLYPALRTVQERIVFRNLCNLRDVMSAYDEAASGAVASLGLNDPGRKVADKVREGFYEALVERQDGISKAEEALDIPQEARMESLEPFRKKRENPKPKARTSKTSGRTKASISKGSGASKRGTSGTPASSAATLVASPSGAGAGAGAGAIPDAGTPLNLAAGSRARSSSSARQQAGKPTAAPARASAPAPGQTAAASAAATDPAPELSRNELMDFFMFGPDHSAAPASSTPPPSSPPIDFLSSPSGQGGVGLLSSFGFNDIGSPATGVAPTFEFPEYDSAGAMGLGGMFGGATPTANRSPWAFPGVDDGGVGAGVGAAGGHDSGDSSDEAVLSEGSV